MNKLDSLKLFVEKDVSEISLKKLLELEKYYQKNKDILVNEFVRSFRESCIKAVEMQNLQRNYKIGYITYSMLRTEMLENKNVYLIEVFNENWFLNPVGCTYIYDASWAFKFLDEFYQEISIAKKAYGGNIGEWEVENIKYKEAEKYNQYIIALARYSVSKIIKLEEFNNLEINNEFEFRVGEYRDTSEVVYKIDKNEKDSDIIKAYFEEKDEDDEYSYEVYENLNLSKGDYKGLDFRYCRFSGSDFNDSSMKKTILLGTVFNNSSMKSVDFRDSIIYEASFKDSDLSYSDFSRVSGVKGLPRKGAWNAPGYECVDFTNCNLEGVKFRNADLVGAVFENAIFKNTDFSGADLTDAVFLLDDKDKLNLSENQMDIITWR